MAHTFDTTDIACQRCGNLLGVHESLLDLNASAFDFLQEREAYHRVGASGPGYVTPPTSTITQGQRGAYSTEANRHPSANRSNHTYTPTVRGTVGWDGTRRAIDGRWLDLPTNAVPQLGRRVVHAPSTLAPSESFVMLTESQFGEALSSVNSNNNPITSTRHYNSNGQHHHHHHPHQQQQHHNDGGNGGVAISTTGHVTSGKLSNTEHGRSSGTSGTNTTIDTKNDLGQEGSSPMERGSFSHRLKIIDMLTELTSQKSTSNEDNGVEHAIGRLEHPLCHQCTDLTLDIMSRQLAELTSERDRYAEFLARLDKDLPDAASTPDLEKELEDLKNEEQVYLDSIREMENQLTTTREEYQKLEKETQELDSLERNRWEEYNEYETKLRQLDAERDSMELALQQASDWMERLQKTNVYNDAFHISQDGPFGTINGFRLGRLPSQPVEWAEINAAWGLTVLLLQTICNRLNFRLNTYKLVPLGSFSRIDRIDEDKAQYELYGSGEFHLGRLLQNRRFDHGMVAFLDCLRQLGEHVEKQDDTLKLPYRIENDRIGDACIRLRFSHEDTWTRALKYALTNTKWLLAISCSSVQRQRTN